MKQFKSTAIALFALALSFSCGKVEVDKNNDIQGYADSQIVGTWKIIAISSDKPFDWDGNGSTETDIFSTWTDCNKDNLFFFDGTKTGTYRYSCNLTKNGTWNMLDRFRIILYPDGIIPQEETIKSLTSNQFITASFVSPVTGQTFEVSKTWQRQ